LVPTTSSTTSTSRPSTTTTTSSSTTTTRPVLGTDRVCGVLRGLLEPFPFLRPLVTSLLATFRCAAFGSSRL
ncbi:MAG: hypothetical protein LC708_00405, partial [Actinobacteria bacterium]|nr:hypothetical protein [Actinomycetota bacterium]